MCQTFPVTKNLSKIPFPFTDIVRAVILGVFFDPSGLNCGCCHQLLSIAWMLAGLLSVFIWEQSVAGAECMLVTSSSRTNCAQGYVKASVWIPIFKRKYKYLRKHKQARVGLQFRQRLWGLAAENKLTQQNTPGCRHCSGYDLHQVQRNSLVVTITI